MLSIEEFKKHLLKDEKLSEEQIIKLRDDQDKMAEIIFSMWLNEIDGKKKV